MKYNLVKKGRLSEFQNQFGELCWLDWLLFAILGIFCYFSFVHSDVMTTGNRSWLFYQSGIFDFYEASHEWTGNYSANYMPSTFWMFGLWLLPLKLFGVSMPTAINEHHMIFVMWYKLLPTLFYLASGYLIYLLALRMRMGSKKAKLCMYAYLTCPVAFFSQFIFSQYDVFTVFFMLWGMLYYFDEQEKSLWKFSLLFGIATTFKYFALLIFLVLLVLREKRVGRMILNGVIMAVPFTIELLMYAGSDSFFQGVMGFNALGFVSHNDFETTMGAANFSKVLCVVLLFWSYFTEPEDWEQLINWALYLCCGMCFVLFGLIAWHPQWLMFAAPFWVLSMYTSKYTEKFLWLDLAFIPVFYSFVMKYWVGGVDDALLYCGIWRPLLLGRETVGGASEYMLPVDLNTLYSIMLAIFLVLFVFKHPKYAIKHDNIAQEKDHIGLLRSRFVLTVLVYAVPVYYWLIKELMSPS